MFVCVSVYLPSVSPLSLFQSRVKGRLWHFSLFAARGRHTEKKVCARVQDSLSALEKLRNELDALTANASSTSAEQKSIENRLSLFPSDFERAGSLATGLEGILSSAGDDSLQRCELSTP